MNCPVHNNIYVTNRIWSSSTCTTSLLYVLTPGVWSGLWLVIKEWRCVGMLVSQNFCDACFSCSKQMLQILFNMSPFKLNNSPFPVIFTHDSIMVHYKKLNVRCGHGVPSGQTVGIPFVVGKWVISGVPRGGIWIPPPPPTSKVFPMLCRISSSVECTSTSVTT
jgi:hypothetical protein